MKHSPDPRRKPTLDDLFALKRAERPPQEFWQDFQVEFHVRQRAAAIEPKRWWFVLPRVFAGLSRYQMPMGAAAVLAVTFLSFREYREPGMELAYAPANPVMVETLETDLSIDAATATVANAAALRIESELPTETDFEAGEAASQVEPVAETVSLSPMVVLAGLAAADRSRLSSPSARSIAANLAAVRAEQPEIVRLPGEPQINLTASRPAAEPLTAIAMPANSAREPLFAYQPVGSSNQADGEWAESGPDVHSQIARHLSDEQLYESVRRLTAGGDRLTLKF